MKLNQLNERDVGDFTASASSRAANNAIDDIESAYEEIALLNKAFEEKNFGVLIGKHGMLTDTDLREIKRKLSEIINTNSLIDAGEVKNGRDTGKLLIKTIGHGFEAAALAAIAGGLATTAVIMAPTVVGTGAASVGAALSLVGAKHQLGLVSSIRSLSKVIELADTYEKLNVRPSRSSPSRIKTLVRWLMGKSEKDIERAAIKKVKKASKKAQMKMQKNLHGFPKYVEYKDRDGEIKEYPTISFFENL